jgi:RimJ/RimL family protein N-acetyltransferase
MILESNTIFFRYVEIEDASFILGLRTDETYNKYLSTVDDSLKKQIDWLNHYKQKEARSEEFYFIICLKQSGQPIGTVRIYDFKKDINSFCWGSWILNDNKTKYAALESALLIYNFAFNELGFSQCHMDIRKNNEKVINFHKRFGVEIVGQTDLDLLGIYTKESYESIRSSIESIIMGYTE